MPVRHLIVERFYDGKLAAWRSIGPKDTSFRKLAARLAGEEGLGLDATTLCLAVGAYELDGTLRDGIATSQYLRVGHYVAVLGLADKTAERILRTATPSADRWRGSARRRPSIERPAAGDPRPDCPS